MQQKPKQTTAFLVFTLKNPQEPVLINFCEGWTKLFVLLLGSVPSFLADGNYHVVGIYGLTT